MPTFYVYPVGMGKVGGTGLSPSEAFNGFSDLQSRGLALTAQGDTIEFLADRGEYGLAEYTYNTYTPNTENTGLPSGYYGPIFGTNQAASSTAAYRIFRFTGNTGVAKINMRGATVATQRMNAALIIRGEGVQVIGGNIQAPNWNFLFNDVTFATRIPWNAGMGPASGPNGEQGSVENNGIIVNGAGITIDGLTVDGTVDAGWSRKGIYVYHPDSGVTSTNNLRSVVRNCNVSGSMDGISVNIVGSGGAGALQIQSKQYIEIYNNFVFNPAWGWAKRSDDLAYNAGAHGNGIEITGAWRGRARIYNNEVTGNFQDGIDIAGGGGIICDSNVVHDIGDPSLSRWAWNTTTSRWFLTFSQNTEGNGIKTGLNTEGTGSVPPSTWLGSDGVNGSDLLQQDEARNQVIGNKIYRCNSQGITTNAGCGIFIHANEIVDVKRVGINISAGGKAGNYCITNNYIRLVYNTEYASISRIGIYVDPSTKIIMANNIIDSNILNTGGTNDYDIFWAAPAATALFKDKNLLVTGRTAGTVPADASGVLAVPGGYSWTPGIGLASTSTLLSAGVATVIPVSKSCRASTDNRNQPWGTSMAVGCYAAPFTRISR